MPLKAVGRRVARFEVYEMQKRICQITWDKNMYD